MPTFLRRIWSRYPKLGKGRKKLQKWRNPTGRHNKMREKRRGYPVVVSVGYMTNQKEKGKIKGKTPVMIYQESELALLQKDMIGIVGNVGKKKRLAIAQKAKTLGKELYNLNPTQYLAQHQSQGDKQ